MGFVQALVLGLIQGITEFLPISSSGHLVFVPFLFNWPDQGLVFDVILHLGTLIAVIWYFRKRLMSLLKAIFSSNLESKFERKFSWLLVFSIIPAGIVGLFFGDFIEKNLRSTLLIALSLIFWGIVLAIAEAYSIKRSKKVVSQIGIGQMIVISLAQAIALIPGTSRSGITMSAGLFSGLDRKKAIEFSFLMSIPIIFLSGLSGLTSLLSSGLGQIDYLGLSIGLLASMISGFFAIKLLMSVVERFGFYPFVLYRLIIGVLIILFLV